MTLSKCSACSGLLLPDEDELRCVNCGRRFYSDQPANGPSRTCRDCEADISALQRNLVRCLSCKGLATDTASAQKNLKTEPQAVPEPEPDPQPVPEPEPDPQPVPEPEPKPRPSEEPILEPGVSPLAGKPSPKLPIRVCQDCKGDMTGRGGSSFRLR